MLRRFQKPRWLSVPVNTHFQSNYIPFRRFESTKKENEGFAPFDPNFEQRVRESFQRQGFMSYLGAKLTRVEPGFVEIELPYRKELRYSRCHLISSQQHGFFHGGVVGTLSDNTGGYASFSLMSPENSVLTVEYKLNLIAPALGDTLISRGRVLKPGRTLFITRSDVFVRKDGEEKLCATNLQTVMTLQGKKDDPSLQK